jgi:hypothetical protein
VKEMGRACRTHGGEYKILTGKLEGKRPRKNLGVDGKIILESRMGSYGLQASGLGYGPVKVPLLYF